MKLKYDVAGLDELLDKVYMLEQDMKMLHASVSKHSQNSMLSK